MAYATSTYLALAAIAASTATSSVTAAKSRRQQRVIMEEQKSRIASAEAERLKEGEKATELSRVERLQRKRRGIGRLGRASTTFGGQASVLG